MRGSEVLVLGGGFGGAAAAVEARRRLGPEHRVTLIDRTHLAHLCGANPLLMVGERPAEGLTRSLEPLAAEGVELVQGEILGIDLDAREVTTDRGGFRFDHLVVALGAVYDWEEVPGSADAHTFYNHEGAVRLRERLAGLDEGSIVVAAARPPYKCPPAPIEGALVLDWWFRKQGVRARVDLHLSIPEPAPLAVAGPDVSARVSRMVEERGVSLHTGAGLVEVGGSGGVARFADGSEIEADVVVAVPAHRVPEVVEASGLTDGKPWVPVDPATLETSTPGVFAVGDVNAIPIGPDRGLPKAGIFASGQGRTVAALIASRILGTEPPPPYTGEGHCFLAFSGEESAQVGGTFLAPDGPRVELGEASVEGMAAKSRWEGDWQAFRV